MIKYLRFNTEAEAKSVLSEFFVNGEWMIASNTHSLDLIGPLQIDDENIDTRYHVNFQGSLTANVSAYEVTPQNPRRVWA